MLLARTNTIRDSAHKLRNYLHRYLILMNAGLVDESSGTLSRSADAEVFVSALSAEPGGGTINDMRREDYERDVLINLATELIEAVKIGKAIAQIDTEVNASIVAKFIPQVYIKGNAVGIDCDFDQDVDVTEEVLMLPLEAIKALSDSSADTDMLISEADDLGDDARKHLELYPYRVEVEDALNSYLFKRTGIGRASHLTEELLMALRMVENLV